MPLLPVGEVVLSNRYMHEHPARGLVTRTRVQAPRTSVSSMSGFRPNLLLQMEIPIQSKMTTISKNVTQTINPDTFVEHFHEKWCLVNSKSSSKCTDRASHDGDSVNQRLSTATWMYSVRHLWIAIKHKFLEEPNMATLATHIWSAWKGASCVAALSIFDEGMKPSPKCICLMQDPVWFMGKIYCWALPAHNSSNMFVMFDLPFGSILVCRLPARALPESKNRIVNHTVQSGFLARTRIQHYRHHPHHRHRHFHKM